MLLLNRERPLLLSSQPIWPHPKLKLLHTAGAAARPNASSWEQGNPGPSTLVLLALAARPAAGKLRSPSQALPTMIPIFFPLMGEGNSEMREKSEKALSLLLSHKPSS